MKTTERKVIRPAWAKGICKQCGTPIKFMIVMKCDDCLIRNSAIFPCVISDFVSWRTPNQSYFIAACQDCGKVVSSIVDGGNALRSLIAAHKRDKEIKP